MLTMWKAGIGLDIFVVLIVFPFDCEATFIAASMRSARMCAQATLSKGRWPLPQWVPEGAGPCSVLMVARAHPGLRIT
jgi:hypothetical protein